MKRLPLIGGRICAWSLGFILCHCVHADFEFGGPTELQDTFLPSQLRYQSYPEAARVISAGSWSVNTTVDWTAHLARTDGYLFDGESVTSTLKIRYSPASKWEFGLDVPRTDRVDGTLDEFIEFVETTLNARVPARYELPRDTYQAFVAGSSGQALALRRGGGWNDVTLRAKYQWLKHEASGFDLASVATFSVPTGSDTFGGNGVSPGLGLHAQYPVWRFNFFAGGAGNYYSDIREQNFRFLPWRGMGYAGMEYKVCSRFAFVFEYQIYSGLAPDYPPLDAAAHYYSVAGRFWLAKNVFFETGVVENLGVIENRNSSDVTFKFSLTARF